MNQSWNPSPSRFQDPCDKNLTSISPLSLSSILPISNWGCTRCHFRGLSLPSCNRRKLGRKFISVSFSGEERRKRKFSQRHRTNGHPFLSTPPPFPFSSPLLSRFLTFFTTSEWERLRYRESNSPIFRLFAFCPFSYCLLSIKYNWHVLIWIEKVFVDNSLQDSSKFLLVPLIEMAFDILCPSHPPSSE